MSEISPRRSATRDRLVEAALGVFAAKGVLGASVEEISEAAGFTRGAFYSNFESKDDLCVAALERFALGGLAATQDTIASLESSKTQSLDELVTHAVRAFLEVQREDRISVLAGAELRLYAAREESFAGHYRAHLDATSKSFAPVLEDAAARLGLELSVPAEQAIGVLAAVYISSALDSFIAGANAVADVSNVLAAALASMLRPR